MNRSQTTVLALIVFSFSCQCHSPLYSEAAGKISPHAQWISPQIDSTNVDKNPCPILRLQFNLSSKPVKSSVRVVGLGHYQLRMNGAQVGSSVINQAWSEYSKTIYTQEFDLASCVRKGENVFGVMLGNSYWRVGPANDPKRYSKTDAMPDFSNGHPYLLWLEAHFLLASDKDTVVTSNASWKWTYGPLVFSHIYGGEDYDARRNPEGWDRASFEDHAWKKVSAVDPPETAILPLTSPPIKEFEIFEPTEIKKVGAEEYTYLFPQNCSALLRFTVSGTSGSRIRFKPCEYVDSAGHVRFTYTWGTNKDIWHDYTVRGSGNETHEILFCYVGCQYVGVTGAVPPGASNPDGLPVIKKIELVHTRAANEVVGAFNCSSELQNNAEHLIDWSIRSNMSYVATDCPHREKNGYQEQNWHMIRAISYRFDVHDWINKILRDVRDTQLPDGHIPTNCPNFMVGMPPHAFWNEAPEWGIAGVLVPWHQYEWYGDTSTLVVSYESMKRYVDYLSTQAKDGIITSNLGDWYDYGHGKGDGPAQWTPAEVSATAIWALGAQTIVHTAEVLRQARDRDRYDSLFKQIISDFQKHFYDRQHHQVINNGSCQAGNATAVCVGLLPEEEREGAIQSIVDDLSKRGWQQTTGEVLHIFLIRALAENGRGDVLHKIYSREGPGSYGFMVREGLTTLPESWSAVRGTGSSMNHFMLGQLMEWHYAYVAGIRQQPGSVGWRKILIAPEPGNMQSASAEFKSPQGRISVHWNQESGKFFLTAIIPAGVEAAALLPDGSTKQLSSGENKLTSAMH
ncbi:MAG TPA: family 78 glycoside hydrolase catalytic domain [Bacteroidota bacterium]|nr:family 78 glycoside hydrolase catalytic domain [Bacteroidota bacterium]